MNNRNKKIFMTHSWLIHANSCGVADMNKTIAVCDRQNKNYALILGSFKKNHYICTL